MRFWDKVGRITRKITRFIDELFEILAPYPYKVIGRKSDCAHSCSAVRKSESRNVSGGIYLHERLRKHKQKLSRTKI